MAKIGDHDRLLASNFALIDGAFVTYLRERGFPRRTICHTRWAIRHAAWWLACRRRKLTTLHPRDLAPSITPSWQPSSRSCYRTGLGRWFRFRNPGCIPFQPAPTSYPWQAWLDNFDQFLFQHRGLAPRSRMGHLKCARAFLIWQFGQAPADWPRVTTSHVWRYARQFTRGRKASTLNQDLCYLRRFFNFVRMRGACSSQLAQAVPRFCNFGQAARREALTDAQRRTLLASFDRRSSEGVRNHCIALCMVDLGLRPMEVTRLSLADIDWGRNVLAVPSTKTDRGRQLPLVPRMAAALRVYVQHHRPSAQSDRLFVYHNTWFVGQAMRSRAIQQIISAACKRCGIDQGSSYRLRHTFATRLHARGADLKQIADLLGHRHLQTTTIYAKVDLNGLRALALPWPL